ncbi:hypothetical protein DAI22_11g189750 [Oryza sativa Japonica Group]|nr:hypothetical protein DAI22_11g189750 [Oryza sativa Japonica Group]
MHTRVHSHSIKILGPNHKRSTFPNKRPPPPLTFYKEPSQRSSSLIEHLSHLLQRQHLEELTREVEDMSGTRASTEGSEPERVEAGRHRRNAMATEGCSIASIGRSSVVVHG